MFSYDFINKYYFRSIACLVLIAYAVLLSVNYKNYFQFYIIVIVTLVYFISNLILTVTKVSNNHKLLIDYVFISFSLYGKDLNEHGVFFMTLIPSIANLMPILGTETYNYSIRKLMIGNLLLYIVLLYDQGLLNLELYKAKFNYSFIYCNLSIWFFTYISQRINNVKIFRNQLMSIIDRYYSFRDGINKPHKVYSKIIQEINLKVKKDVLKNIICFHIPYKGRENVINSASYIWQHEFKKPNFHDRISKEKVLYNEELIIDGELLEINAIIQIRVGTETMLFVFIFNKELENLDSHAYFSFAFLEPILMKIARLIFNENQISKIRDEQRNKLKKNRSYVNSAVSAMHFIRNRLSPISNLVEMSKLLNNIPEEKLVDFTNIYNDELKRCEKELNEIRVRTNKILDKTKNPFIFSEPKAYSIQSVYSFLKQQLYCFLPDSEVSIISNIKQEQIRTKTCKINEDGFNIFLADWISNIKKHYNRNCNFSFIINESEIEILFENNHKLSSQEFEKLIQDINSNDRNQIIKRKTHGLYLIKESLIEMGIKYNATKGENNNLILTIKIDLL